MTGLTTLGMWASGYGHTRELCTPKHNFKDILVPYDRTNIYAPFELVCKSDQMLRKPHILFLFSICFINSCYRQWIKCLASIFSNSFYLITKSCTPYIGIFKYICVSIFLNYNKRTPCIRVFKSDCVSIAVI